MCRRISIRSHSTRTLRGPTLTPPTTSCGTWMRSRLTTSCAWAATWAWPASPFRRLGQEDASLWGVLGRHGLTGGPDSLRSVPAGYNVEFVNDVVCESRPGVRIVGPHRECPRGEEPDSGGDILRVREWPTRGVRALATDASGTGRPQSSHRARPQAVCRRSVWAEGTRGRAHVRCTPHGTWTPLILDTLKKYRAPATFFLIGENVDTHMALTRRIYAEGHEIGNHTYSHPNLALTLDKRTRVELDANENLIESVIDHCTAFFRPPYFGDATPTTPDELGARRHCDATGILHRRPAGRLRGLAADSGRLSDQACHVRARYGKRAAAPRWRWRPCPNPGGSRSHHRFVAGQRRYHCAAVTARRHSAVMKRCRRFPG